MSVGQKSSCWGRTLNASAKQFLSRQTLSAGQKSFVEDRAVSTGQNSLSGSKTDFEEAEQFRMRQAAFA